MTPSDKYEQIKDIKHLNSVEIEAMVLKHEQQIKDIAAHLLELKQLVTPMMEFKRREWVGLEKGELEGMFNSRELRDIGSVGQMIEARLKAKNT